MDQHPKRNEEEENPVSYAFNKRGSCSFFFFFWPLYDHLSH
jgi:hypothetical protein